MINVKFIRSHPKAILPKRNHNSSSSIRITGDSGYDLHAVEDVLIPPTSLLPLYEADDYNIMDEEDLECSSVVNIGTAVVPVGLQLAYVEDGYWFRIEARSGLGFKFGVQPHFGIIDNQYRGDLAVKLYNLTGKPYQVQAGDRIAQIVFYPIVEAKMEFTEAISNTERGDKRLGSSGK